MEPRFTLRALPFELPGLELVRLEAHPDPDGRSGTSSFPVALVRHEDGAWSFVHVTLDVPGSEGLTRASPPSDVHLHVAACNPDAQGAVLAAPYAERTRVVVERCSSLDARVAAAVLAVASGDDVPWRINALLQQVMATLDGSRSFRIATGQSGSGAVDRDARWLAGGAFEPWVATRDGDVVTASGTMRFERTWFRFSLRVDMGLTMELGAVATVDSHGDPP